MPNCLMYEGISDINMTCIMPFKLLLEALLISLSDIALDSQHQQVLSNFVRFIGPSIYYLHTEGSGIFAIFLTGEVSR